jgi:hypothetical protein
MNFKKVRTVKRKDDNYYRVWEKGFLSADCGESALDDIGYLPVCRILINIVITTILVNIKSTFYM